MVGAGTSTVAVGDGVYPHPVGTTTGRELTLCYVHSGSIGYGRLGEQLAGALTASGVEVYDRQDIPEGVTITTEDRKVLADGDRRSKRTNTVCWTEVLHRTFKSEQEAENAVAQLMEFD